MSSRNLDSRSLYSHVRNSIHRKKSNLPSQISCLNAFICNLPKVVDCYPLIHSTIFLIRRFSHAQIKDAKIINSRQIINHYNRNTMLTGVRAKLTPKTELRKEVFWVPTKIKMSFIKSSSDLQTTTETSLEDDIVQKIGRRLENGARSPGTPLGESRLRLAPQSRTRI